MGPVAHHHDRHDRRAAFERESDQPSPTGATRGPPARARKAEVMSAGEPPIKQAVTWIDDQLLDNPDADRVKLVDQASRRFDLSPVEADFLFRHLAERPKPA